MQQLEVIKFAVKSNYFSIYEAFVKELQTIGYRWNDKFNPCTVKAYERCTCIYVSDYWGGEAVGPMMSFSNPGDRTSVIDLDTDFHTAISTAKEQYRDWKSSSISVKINSEYTAVISKSGIKVGCQTIDASVAKELNKAFIKLGLV
jgi:hypothetical protein